jgi:endonuclease/exonuclease/phosphatase (EEP) superfamily protein YafD
VWSLLSLAAFGALLHFTLRDAWQWPTAAVYYALPRPILALLTSLAAFAARRLSTRECRIALFAALACLVWTVSVECRWPPRLTRKPLTPPWRIVEWNAAHLPRGVRTAADVIRKWDADVIGIVEAGTTYQLELEEWERALPDYHIVCPRPQMLLISPHEIRDVEVISIGRHSDVAVARIERGTEVLNVALVDIISNLGYGRSEPLRRLAQVVETRDSPPHVVMGDFNTPPESVWFAPLRQQYRLAFEVAGTGNRATWPVPVPVLQLDYLWISANVFVAKCHHGWTTASDHRPVMADVTIDTTITPPSDFPLE